MGWSQIRRLAFVDIYTRIMIMALPNTHELHAGIREFSQRCYGLVCRELHACDVAMPLASRRVLYDASGEPVLMALPHERPRLKDIRDSIRLESSLFAAVCTGRFPGSLSDDAVGDDPVVQCLCMLSRGLSANGRDGSCLNNLIEASYDLGRLCHLTAHLH